MSEELPRFRVVLDTNIIVSALRSANGAAAAVIALLADDQLEAHLSLPLYMQYKDVVLRHTEELRIPSDEISAALESIKHLSVLHDIHFLLRPELEDEGDNLVLELAFTARVDFIVTHNVRDFLRSQRYGIVAITPLQLIRLFGERL